MANLTAEPSADKPPGLTIDELAERAGMSVRNLREWHRLGLLPAAEMRGRVGYYDESVLERIEAVGRLREEGFKLPLIARMLEAAGDSAAGVIALAEDLQAPFRASDSADRGDATRRELAALGMSEAQVEAAAGEIAAHADGIAAVFERVWMEHVWEPFLAGDPGEAELAELRRTLARMQPRALETVAAAFTAAMQERVGRGIEREIARAADGG